MNKIVVLSFFDGMSCGQIALRELGYDPLYYAAEIDKFAIQQSKHVFPNMIHLGDVTKVKAKDLPKIDLFLGGSPCQGFSFAGKQLNFDDPRSALFFEFARLWNEIKEMNPDAKFLLENVDMKKDHLRVISEYMGVFPQNINSNLYSAQNRNRWYWSNIRTRKEGLFNDVYTDFPKVQDRGIYINDILQPENEIDKKYYLSDKILKGFLNSDKLHEQKGTGFRFKPIQDFNKKSNTLTARYHKMSKSDNYIVGAMRGREYICASQVGRKINEHGKREDYNPNIKNVQRLELRNDNKTNCLTTVAKDNLLTNGHKIRRLTPLECSRLQTVPLWYEWVVSDTQIYRMCGNGWTVEPIKHMLSFL